MYISCALLLLPLHEEGIHKCSTSRALSVLYLTFYRLHSTFYNDHTGEPPSTLTPTSSTQTLFADDYSNDKHSNHSMKRTPVTQSILPQSSSMSADYVPFATPSLHCFMVDAINLIITQRKEKRKNRTCKLLPGACIVKRAFP